MEQSDVMGIAEAAAELGVSVETLVGWMVEDGVLIEHPNGGYVAGPHPAIQPLTD
jgi:phage antirepressor YoqD-like protein